MFILYLRSFEWCMQHRWMQISCNLWYSSNTTTILSSLGTLLAKSSYYTSQWPQQSLVVSTWKGCSCYVVIVYFLLFCLQCSKWSKKGCNTKSSESLPFMISSMMSDFLIDSRALQRLNKLGEPSSFSQAVTILSIRRVIMLESLRSSLM